MSALQLLERIRKQRSSSPYVTDYDRAMREARKWQPSLPGDPTLDRTENSQAFGSQAYGETQIEAAKEAARQQLKQPGLSDDEREKLLYTARTGEQEPAGFLGGLMGVIDLIDRPGALVRTAISDLLYSPEDKADDIGLSDYWDAIRGHNESIIERHGEEVAGKHGRFGGSQILSLMGWEPEENVDGIQPMRGVRGLADFGVEILTDPLSYITLGAAGLGRPVASASVSTAFSAARGAVAQTAEGLVEKGGLQALRSLADDVADPLAKRLADDVAKLADDAADALADEAAEIVRKSGVAEGTDLFDDAVSSTIDEMMRDPETAGRLLTKRLDDTVQDVGNEVTQLVLRNQYKTLADEHSYWMRSDLVDDIVKGGLRITTPFGRKGVNSSIRPFGDFRLNSPSRALYERVVPERTKDFLGKFRQMFQSSSNQAIRVRLGVEGKGMTYQTMDVAVRQALVDAGVTEALPAKISSSLESLKRAAENADFKIDDAERTLSGLLGSAPKARQAALDKIDDPALRSALEEAFNGVRDTLNQVWGAYVKADIQALGKRSRFYAKAKKLEKLAAETGEEFDLGSLMVGGRTNYFPIVGTEDLRTVINRIQRTQGVSIGEAPPGMEVGYDILRVLLGEGNTNARASIVGHTAYAKQRGIANTLALEHDGSVGMLDIDEMLERFAGQTSADTLSVSYLNDEVGRAIDHVLRQNPSLAPKLQRAGVKAFDDNVAQVMDGYVASMVKAIEVRTIMDVAQRTGLARTQEWLVDQQRVLFRLQKNVGEARRAEMKALWEDLGDILEETNHYASINESTVTERIQKVGPDELLLELPQSVASRPEVREAIKTYRTKLREAQKLGRSIARQEDIAVTDLVKQGIPSNIARRVVRATRDAEITALQDELVRAAHAEARDLMDVAAATVGELADNVLAHDALVRESVEKANRLKQKVREEVRKLESLKPQAEEITETVTKEVKRKRKTAALPGVEAQIDVAEEVAEDLTPKAISPSPEVIQKLMRSAGLDDIVEDVDENITRFADNQLLDDLWNSWFIPWGRNGDKVVDPETGAAIRYLMAANEQYLREEFEGLERQAGMVARAWNENLWEFLFQSSKEMDAQQSALQKKMRGEVRKILGNIGIDWSWRDVMPKGANVDLIPPSISAMPTNPQDMPAWLVKNFKAVRSMVAENLGVGEDRIRLRDGKIWLQPEPTNIGKTPVPKAKKAPAPKPRDALSEMQDERFAKPLTEKRQRLVDWMAERPRPIDAQRAADSGFSESMLRALERDGWLVSDISPNDFGNGRRHYWLSDKAKRARRGTEPTTETVTETVTRTRTRKGEVKSVRATLRKIKDLIGEGTLTPRELIERGAEVADQLDPAYRRTWDAIQNGGIPGFEVEHYLNLSETVADTTTRLGSGMTRHQADGANRWSKVAYEMERMMEKPTRQRLARLRKAWYGPKDAPNEGARKALQQLLPREEFQRFENTMGLFELAYDTDIPSRWKAVAQDNMERWEALPDMQAQWEQLWGAIETPEELARQSAAVVRTTLGRVMDSWYRLATDFGAETEGALTRVVPDQSVLASDDFLERFKEFRQLMKDAEQTLGENIDPLLDDVLKARVKDARKMVDDMAKTEPVKRAVSTGEFAPASTFGIGGEVAENLELDPTFGALLEAQMAQLQAMHTPEGMRELFQQFSGFRRWWKAAVTVGRTSDFILNNILGGLWNGMAAGVGVQDYKRVGTNLIKWRNAMRRGVDPEKALEGLDPAFRKMIEVGVIGTSFAEVELRGISERSGKIFAEGLSSLKFWDADDFALFRAGGWMMESAEDWMRAATFLRWYDEANPQSWVRAKAVVDAVHFDYGDLSGIERKVQNWIPFYTWTRRNVPLQLRLLVEQPRVMARYAHMMQAVGGMYEDESDLPLPYTHGLGQTIGSLGEGDFATRLIFDPRLPVTDLGELFESVQASPSGWFGYLESQMGPWATLPFDLVREEGWGDVNAPIGLREVMKWADEVGVADYTVTDEGDAMIPRWVRTALETANPLWRNLVENVAPTDPRRKQRLGWDDPEGDLAERLRGFLIEQIGGTGVRISSPSDVASVSFDARDDINDMAKKLKLEGSYIQP